MPRHTLLILLVLGFLKLSAQNTTQFLDATVIINGNSSGLGTTFGGNLGTFSCSQSLSLDGFTATTQQCGNCKTNATVLAYRVNKIGETTANFSFVNNSNSSNLTEVNGCLPIVWEKTAYNHNLLNGLSDGIYTLEIYVIAQGENCDNNSVETGRFSANFTVENPLSVTKPSLLATPACRGKNFTLNATTSGATYYEWQKKENGVWQTISGENGAATETISLNFSGIYTPTSFRAVVRNCSNLNEKISEEIEIVPQSPQISVQPINLTNCLGQDVFFKTSSPSNTARYQWQWSNNGAGFVNLSATTHYVAPTSNELKLNDLLSGDHEDAFRCIITDANGCTDTTQAAMVFVNRKSTILAEESAICEGKTNALTARSLYGNIETYQWQLRNTAGTYENLTESTDFVGVTDQQLHLFSIPKANTHYRVSMRFSAVSMDNNGMPQATTCLLTETRNFIINPRPTSPNSFSENRCGAGTIDLQAPQVATAYRWYADTTTTHLATTELFSPTVTASQSFFLSNIDAKSCESYRTEIPVMVHAVPQLSVETWDEICPSAASFSLSYNATISDSVFIKSTELTGFHGFKEETNLSSIEIPMPDNPLSGNYLFKINTINKETNCSSEEKEFTLKIKEKTTLSIDTTTTILCEATPFSFVATATGAGTLGYQWLKNDEEISGETASFFTKNSSIIADSGNYRCRVTAECGEAISDEKPLLILPGIRIQQQPKDSTVCQNRAAKFSVQATGEGVLRYQWKKNGENIGTNTNELLLENLQPSDNNATIVCEIHSDCGKTLSNSAKLTVISLPEKPIVAATGFCQSSIGQPLTAISATNNTLFWWGTNSAGGSANQEAATPPTNVLGTTTYYVSQTTPEGCEGQRAALDVEISAPVTVRLSASQRGICATGFLNKTAKIVAFPSGGNGTFLYEWKNGNGLVSPETDSVLVATESSLYTIKVTSKYCSVTDNFEITSLLSELNNSPLSPNHSVCNGENVTFTATYNLSGGQFRWYDNATSELFVSNNNPFVLPTITESRTYYVSYSMEQDFLRCESPRTQVEVTVQSPILINSQPKSITRCKGNTAKFSVIGSNITAYQWERKLPNGTFQTIAGATTKDLSLSNIGNATNPHETVYRVQLFNENCSILSDEATLFVNSQDENLDSKTACLGQNVQFSAPATTGKILSYEWQKRMGSSGAWQAITDATSENLDLQNVQLSEDNTYYRCRLVFDNHDGTTCVITTDDARLTVRKITLSVNVNHVACFGENSGKITALPTGGSGYSFQLNGGSFQTNPLFEGLIAGNYTITVKSSEGCSASIDTSISQPLPILLTDIVIQNSSCEGANGSISFSASGGTGTLFSAVSNDIFTESSTFSNLSGGSYVLKIKDQSGCQKDSTITVGGKATPVISTQPVSQTDCKGNGVNFSFVATNASQIQWQKQNISGIFENIQNENNTILKLTNIGNSTNPDQTKFRVKIENDGCEVFSDIVTLHVNDVPYSWKDTILCIGASYQFDVATLQPKGTILSYQWQYKLSSSAAWNSVIGETNSQLNFTNLTTQNSGYYRCRLVFDNHDGTTCVITTDDARLTVREVTLSVNVNHVACFGENSGKITALPAGGSGYSFQLNGGSFQTNPLFEGLIAGNYTIIVKSSEGCSAAIDTSISQPSPILLTDIVTQNSSCEGANGSISFSVSGGTGTLFSALSNDIFTENRLFPNLSGGSYVLKIKDQNGCQKDSTITVGGKATPVISTQPISQTDCKGNGVNFSFVATNASQIQWQKQNSSGIFENIQNENNTILKLTNVGNSTNPDQTKFRAKIENDGCEVFTDIVTLHVNSIPYSWKDTILCIGASYQFDVATLQPKGTILSYQWQYKPSSSAAWNSIIGEPNSQLNFTNLTTQNSGYYRCRFVFDNHDGTTCVITTDDARLTVRENFAPTITADRMIICDIEKVTLSASGCNGIVIWSNGFVGFTLESDSAGTFSAQCNAYGCLSPSSNSVTIQTGISPTKPIITGDTTFLCGNDKAILIASGCTGTIAWSNGNVGTSIEVSEAGTYTAACETSCGQSEPSHAIQIQKNNLPTAGTITTSKAPNCVGYNPPEIENTTSPTGSPFVVSWEQKTTSSDWVLIPNATEITFNPTTLSETTYFRRLVINSCGQAISSPDSIVILPDPTLQVSADKTEICSEETLQLSAQQNGGAGNCVLTWQKNNRSNAPTSSYWETLSDTGETITLSNLTNTGIIDSTVHFRAIIDCNPTSCNKFTSSAISVKILPKSKISLSVKDTTVCKNSTVLVVASGCSGQYFWSNGANTPSIEVSPTTSERYVVSCTTSCGIAKDSCFVGVDDTVLLPPVSTTPSGVVEPAILQFSAAGVGLRWYNSATSTEFSSVAPSHSSEGNYSYWVAQSNGICVSSRTKITAAVYKPLTILQQPTNQFDCKGNGVDISVNARGVGTIRYQWQRKLPNSTTFVDLVEGESGIKFPTSALLKVSNVGSLFNPHLAVYRCIISDSLQTMTSNEAQLNVNSLQGTFPNIELCIGKNYEADISEKFIITGNVSTYQWQSRAGTRGNWNNITNDTRVQGSETKKLIINNLRYEDTQYYRCVVSFQTGGILCNEATDASRLTVGSYPNKPADFSVEYCQFEKAKKLDYDSQNDVLWYEENQAFGNEKAPTPPTHEARKITYFYTEITDEGCESEKGKITVQVHEEPKPPISTTPSLVKEGTPLVFSAEGKNLKWFTSRTGKTFTTNAPVYSLPKTYSHYVSQTSEFGCESERTFISAMIRQTLSILQLPTNQADCNGNSVSFAVKAEGWGTVSYQWQRKCPNENDFSNVPNETASKLTIKDVGSSENPDATLYRCIVQDSESELVSTAAKLIVNSIEGTLSDRIICEGEKLIIDNKSLKINGLPIKYEWQKQEGRTWISADSSENNWQNQGITKPEMAGDYRLKITFRVDNKTTCNRTTKEMKLTVNKAPTSPDSSLYSYCKNSTFLPNLLPTSSKNTILWYASKSDTIPLAEPFKNLVNNAILFAATQDNKQCKSPKSRIEINVLPSPPPPITDSLLRYCLGAKTHPLVAKSAVLLQWFNEEETALTQVPTPKANTEGTQIFFVAALDSNGCQSEKRQITIETQPCLAEIGTTSQENCTEISIEKVSGRKWFTFTNDAGQAFAAINPNGLNLGKVTLSFKGYRQSPITQNGIQILPRYFNFYSSVTDNFSNEISLKLFFSENEIPTQNSPQIIHYEGINEDCSFENNNNFERGESVVFYKNIRLENQFTYKAIAFETTSFSEFGVSYSLFSELRSELSVLPKNAVKIQWNVTKNQQPLAYGIQRSADKKTWQTWQWIPAEKTSYEIIDEQPIDSISYYRIVFRNTDGTLKYFDSMKAQLTDNQAICSVYPNPVNVTADIPLYVRGLRPKIIELLDLQGKSYEISVQNTENSHYQISPKRPLAASSYFLRVTDREGNHCIAKFVSF